MRKHDVRKWLHAILDLLPVLVIPVFMIFVRNENYQSSISITQNIDRQVDFNQKIIDIDNSSKIYTYSGSTSVTDNTIYCSNAVGRNGFMLQYDYIYNCVANHVYLFKCYSLGDGVNAISVNIFNSPNYVNFNLNNQVTEQLNEYRFTATNNAIGRLDCFPSVVGVTSSFQISQPQLYDLTQMFGSGSEPSIEEFDTYFTNSYYSYAESRKFVIDNFYTVTYNDTDVGSQMFYTLYNSVDKYFNMGNVFNLNGVYDWFVFNIFGGNFSPSIYIVWQVVLYEFVMDLLFLLYGLFMWFIDMIQKFMDKPLNSVR